MGRSIRRHHYERRKNKVKGYYDGWAGETERANGKVANHPTLCSDICCGNPRRHKVKIEVEEGFDQDGRTVRIPKKHAFSKKDRLTKKELMNTLDFEMEADGI